MSPTVVFVATIIGSGIIAIAGIIAVALEGERAAGPSDTEPR